MSRRAQENIVAIVVLCLFVAVIAMSMGYGPRARLVPIPVAVIGIILTLIQLVWQNLKSADDLQIDLLEVLTRQEGKAAPAAAKKEAPREGKQAKAGHARRELAAFALVLAVLGVVVLLGPIPAIWLLTVTYFATSRHYSPMKSFVVGSVFTAAVYLLFVVALEVQLYHGVLQPVVDWWLG